MFTLYAMRRIIESEERRMTTTTIFALFSIDLRFRDHDFKRNRGTKKGEASRPRSTSPFDHNLYH